MGRPGFAMRNNARLRALAPAACPRHGITPPVGGCPACMAESMRSQRSAMGTAGAVLDEGIAKLDAEAAALRRSA